MFLILAPRPWIRHKVPEVTSRTLDHSVRSPQGLLSTTQQITRKNTCNKKVALISAYTSVNLCCCGTNSSGLSGGWNTSGTNKRNAFHFYRPPTAWHIRFHSVACVCLFNHTGFCTGPRSQIPPPRHVQTCSLCSLKCLLALFFCFCNSNEL